jgi:hypothetical protein
MHGKAPRKQIAGPFLSFSFDNPEALQDMTFSAVKPFDCVAFLSYLR